MLVKLLAKTKQVIVSTGAQSVSTRTASEPRPVSTFEHTSTMSPCRRCAATTAKFLDDTTYARAQIDFVWVVVTHLTERGVMDAELLYEPPFTDHAPNGPKTCSAAPTSTLWLMHFQQSARQQALPRVWPEAHQSARNHIGSGKNVINEAAQPVSAPRRRNVRMADAGVGWTSR